MDVTFGVVGNRRGNHKAQVQEKSCTHSERDVHKTGAIDRTVLERGTKAEKRREKNNAEWNSSVCAGARASGIDKICQLRCDYRCPAFTYVSHPDPLASRLAYSEYCSEYSEVLCQPGRQPIGTYVDASV